MMLDAHLSLEAQGLLWMEAMNAATSLVNIAATSTRDVCAYESYYGKKSIVYENLQPFGQIGYVTKQAKLYKKFAEKSTKCICLSNAKDHAVDVYQVYNTETKSTQFSRDI